MNLFDIVGGRQEINPNAATQGWNVGKDAGMMSAQAGPAAFALDVIKAKQAEDARRAGLAVEQQKARAAGVQRIITEGMSEGASPNAREAAETLITTLQSQPAFAQAAGFDPSKFDTTKKTSLTEMLAGTLIQQQTGTNPFMDSSASPITTSPTKYSPTGVSGEIINPDFERYKASVEGESKATVFDFQNAKKLEGALKTIASIGDQFKQALPDSGDYGDFTAPKRLEGLFAKLGAQSGVKSNPDLLALTKLQRPFAIQIIRALGEVGNLSKTEQEAAIDTIQFEGLSTDEVDAVVRSFSKIAFARMSSEAREVLMNSPDAKSIMAAFGVKGDDILKFGGKKTLSPQKSAVVAEAKKRGLI